MEYMQFFTDQFFSILMFLYQTTGNLGVAIIVLTVVIRLILVPLSLPSLRAREALQKLQPELKKLKNKHSSDKKALQQAQIELYKKYNVNPLAGCIPQLVQIGLLIFLYHAFVGSLGRTEINGVVINPRFLWLNLTQPDQLFILPIIAGVTQLFLSLMIAPGGEVRDIVPNKSKNKKIKAENKKEEDVADMAATMQKQMILFMPIITAFTAMRFPSGLALYWTVATIFSLVQQYFISGLGGIKIYTERLMRLVNKS
jgi:YidC/Oxa1 family membrane protein insertase